MASPSHSARLQGKALKSHSFAFLDAVAVQLQTCVTLICLFCIKILSAEFSFFLFKAISVLEGWSEFVLLNFGR